MNKKFNANEIAREEYWKGLQSFLSEIILFAQAQKKYSTEIEINQGEVFLKIRTSKTSYGKVVMALNPKDIRSVPFTVLAHGFYEPFQSDILIELGNRSKIFVDIGANAGFYSLALCKENKKLYVHSFEPNPNVFETLNLNLKLNQLNSRIKTYNLGLYFTNDKLMMFEPKFTRSSGASFKKLHNEEGSHLEFIAKVKKLDSYKLSKIDLIKIDVEGCEYNVFLGAKKTILSSKATICVELLRKWMKPFGHKPQDLVSELLDLGYICFAISKNNLVKIKEIDENTRETNFIFCHKSRIKHMNYLYTQVR